MLYSKKQKNCGNKKQVSKELINVFAYQIYTFE